MFVENVAKNTTHQAIWQTKHNHGAKNKTASDVSDLSLSYEAGTHLDAKHICVAPGRRPVHVQCDPVEDLDGRGEEPVASGARVAPPSADDVVAGVQHVKRAASRLGVVHVGEGSAAAPRERWRGGLRGAGRGGFSFLLAIFPDKKGTAVARLVTNRR